MSIPSSDLLVTVSGKHVTVKAKQVYQPPVPQLNAPARSQLVLMEVQVSAELRDFTWMYKQKGFPWLKDRGSADAEVEEGEG